MEDLFSSEEKVSGVSILIFMQKAIEKINQIKICKMKTQIYGLDLISVGSGHKLCHYFDNFLLDISDEFLELL